MRFRMEANVEVRGGGEIGPTLYASCAALIEALRVGCGRASSPPCGVVFATGVSGDIAGSGSSKGFGLDFVGGVGTKLP